MIYLQSFQLWREESEITFFQNQMLTCYSTYYPFLIFPKKELTRLTFEPITFFYGGNGCGKTTLINIIAEAIGAQRGAPYNKSSFFDQYAAGCEVEWKAGYQDSTVITSDDVFDYIFDIRKLNEGVDSRREELFDQYQDLKYSKFRFQSLEDYEKLKKVNQARSHSKSEFVRQNLVRNVPERSNGESALMYFTNKIKENQVYLLDEPENSLSAEFQLELMSFIEDSARFFNCQFIIATHSPFLLSAKEAKIYDLDAVPVCTKKWTQLGNVRKYFDFFMEHKEEFE